MSNRKKRRSESGVTDREIEVPSATPAGGRPVIWSGTRRTIASVLLLVYLAIVLVGPLSNPVASPHFSAPIAVQVAPIHRLLFLGHGYRFFAPDPGPSHRLIYRGIRADGSEFDGHFPDRKNNWPRLLYHRWFMLSETMFNETFLKPTAQQLEEQNKEYDREIARYRAAGKLDLCEQLQRERETVTEAYQSAEQRIEVLASRIAKVLLERNDGQSIEIFVQEREIPFPEQVASGIRLEDESFLSELLKIGALDASGFQAASPEADSGEGAPK